VGTVYKLSEPEALMEEAWAVARDIAAKPAHVVRCAKQALNGIDPSNLHNNYRLDRLHVPAQHHGEGGKAAMHSCATSVTSRAEAVRGPAPSW